MIDHIRSSCSLSLPASSASKKAQPADAVPEEALSPEAFRQEFYADAAKVTRHPTVVNSAVQISDEGFEAMQADPAYRQQMLDLIGRDLGSSYAPRPASVMIRIGATADDYRADSWPVGCDSEFHDRVRQAEKKEDYWQRQKEFQARRRAEYRSLERAMQASALKHAADSAWLRQQPGSSGPRAVEAYMQNSTTSVFEGFSLWENPLSG